mmetsp:Transcript_24458/g.48719  ORF Transcript_24458/g.48719 Transcript_24458/m.48719 type:complete len:102 (-) Transcript_24458:162-467(-)
MVSPESSSENQIRGTISPPSLSRSELFTDIFVERRDCSSECTCGGGAEDKSSNNSCSPEHLEEEDTYWSWWYETEVCRKGEVREESKDTILKEANNRKHIP